LIRHADKVKKELDQMDAEEKEQSNGQDEDEINIDFA
jgi:hypothetical protein